LLGVRRRSLPQRFSPQAQRTQICGALSAMNMTSEKATNTSEFGVTMVAATSTITIERLIIIGIPSIDTISSTARITTTMDSVHNDINNVGSIKIVLAVAA